MKMLTIHVGLLRFNLESSALKQDEITFAMPSTVQTSQIITNFSRSVIVKPKVSTLFSTTIEFFKKTSFSNLCHAFYNALHLTSRYGSEDLSNLQNKPN